MKPFLFTICFLFQSLAQAQSSASAVDQGLAVLKNNQAVARDFKTQEFDVRRFLSESLKWNFDLCEAHLNLGILYTQLNRKDEARQSFLLALNTAPSRACLFAANYNLGVLVQEKKDKAEVDTALAFYQSALAVNPDSFETKVNIELLIQSQQEGGQGEEPNDKDKKDESGKDGENKDDSKGKEQNEKKDDEGQSPKPQQPAPQKKPTKQEFKSADLSKADVNKILGEIRNQEKNIRNEFQKKDAKESPNEKDW
jgi:tetratricopeptide (TPR) repeat protein